MPVPSETGVQSAIIEQEKRKGASALSNKLFIKRNYKKLSNCKPVQQKFTLC